MMSAVVKVKDDLPIIQWTFAPTNHILRSKIKTQMIFDVFVVYLTSVVPKVPSVLQKVLFVCLFVIKRW